MNEKRIAIGLAAWFLGTIVPAFHHAALYAAMGGPKGNVFERSELLFESLPWIDTLYFFVMVITGTILIVSGMFHRPATAQ